MAVVKTTEAESPRDVAGTSSILKTLAELAKKLVANSVGRQQFCRRVERH